ncbi:3'-5' exonuclease [Stygiomarasmius scandens]|uniref:3'-5' exonuclease n=1 Tax=Marasmiellus scandens TaxID=2682957 RepID=A0ABR1K3P6_9AGAR
MVAKPFDEIQNQVAELIKDKILVGHAVYNDLKALLLSHPRPLVRDTQFFAGKHKVAKSKYVALRNLVKQELDVTIQGGEHSSLTDARATMAVYRLHRKEWEKGSVGSQTSNYLASGKKGRTPESGSDDDEGDVGGGETKHKKGKKRKLSVDEDATDEEGTDQRRNKPKKTRGREDGRKEFPGGGRKGVSSGLSTIVKRKGKGDEGSVPGSGKPSNSRNKTQWWKELGSGSGGKTQAKFSLSL